MGRVAVEPASIKVPDATNDEFRVVVFRSQIGFGQKRLRRSDFVQDRVQGLSAIHTFERLFHQAFQRAGAVVQHAGGARGVRDHGTMARHQNRGPQCQHPPERGCPFGREPLDLARVARVGEHPDDEIAADQDSFLGQPHIRGVIGFAASVRQFEAQPANRQGQRVVIDRVRTPMVPRKHVAGVVELPAHDQTVQIPRLVIALEAVQDVPVRDDAWTRNVFGVGLLVQQPRTPGVVDVTVGVDDGVDTAAVPATDRLACVFRAFPAAGIYQHQAVTGANGSDVAEKVAGGDDDHIVGNRVDGTAGDRGGPFLHGRLAGPKPFDEVVDAGVGHVLPLAVEGNYRTRLLPAWCQ